VAATGLIAIAFFLIVAGFIEPNRPAASFSFSGTLATDLGMKPRESAEIDYIGFRTGQALQLVPGSKVNYDVDKLELRRGSIEFWLKLDSPASNTPIPIIYLNGNHAPRFEILLNNKTIELLYQPDSSTPLKLLRTDQVLPGKGTWCFWSFRWDASDKYEMYMDAQENGQPIQLTDVDEPIPDRPIGDGKGLIIGIPSDSAAKDEFGIDLRNLTIWPFFRSEKAIQTASAKELKEMEAPLLWSAIQLNHYAGTRIEDKEARGGFAWTPDSEIARQEGVRISKTGEYKFDFRIKPLVPISAESLSCTVWKKTADGAKTVTASWKNDWMKPNQTNGYRDVVLPFQASSGDEVGFEFQSFIPSKYSLLLDTASFVSADGNWEEHRRFEDLQHTMGVWMEDPQAKGAKAWTNANTLHYGPYVCLGQPGKYRASWRIKISPELSPNAALLLLDVFAHDGFYPDGRRGHKPYAKLALSTSEFSKRNAYEVKSIDFNYDGSNMMEFRAFARLFQPGILNIDTIKVEGIRWR